MQKIVFIDVHTSYFFESGNLVERFEKFLSKIAVEMELTESRPINKSLKQFNKNFQFIMEYSLRNLLFYVFQNLTEGKYIELESRILQSVNFIIFTQQYNAEYLFQVQDKINIKSIQTLKHQNIQIKGFGSLKFSIIQQILERSFLISQFGKDFLDVSVANDNDQKKIYCIAQNIKGANKFIENFLNISDWDNSKQMIYFCNFCFKTKQKKYEQQFNDYGLKYCIMSLQNIQAALEQSEQGQNIKRVAIAAFEKGFYSHLDLFENQEVQLFPLDLTFTRQQKIDLIIGKTSSLMKYFKNASIKDLKDFHAKLQEYLKKNNSADIYNNLSLDIDQIYFDRVLLQKYFEEKSKDHEFQEMLKEEDVKIVYPKQIYLENCDYETIKQEILDKNINYPILTKPRISVTGLVKNSHNFGIIQTEKGLKRFTEDQKDLKDFIIQEFVVDCSSTFKIYRIFDIDHLKINNEIDLDLVDKNYQIIDCKVALKEIIQIDEKMKEKKLKLFSKFSKIIQNWGFINFGIDIVQKRGTNEYFFIDINCKPIYLSSKNDYIQVASEDSLQQILNICKQQH